MKEYTVRVLENGTKNWYLNGKRHREDGPAVECADGDKEWWLNGERHRKDGPAIDRAHGTKYWFLNGKLHREDGPASEWAHSKEWWLNGKRHREDGPAIERADGTKYWLLHGHEVTEEEHKRRTSGITMDDALAAGDGVILREQAERIKEAAPDLLEALELALISHNRLLLSDPPKDAWVFNGVEAKARAAIAKAKGE